MSQVTTKVCRFCQTDVSGKPRIKDKKGRYACQPCFEKLKARQEQAQRIPEPKSNPYSAFAPDIDTDAISLDAGGGVAEARTMPCPSCKAVMGANDVFCVNCGTNVQTGGKLGTVKVKKAKARKVKLERPSSNDGGTVSAVFSIVFAIALAVGMLSGNRAGVPPIVLNLSLLLFIAYAGAIGISTLVAAFRQDGLVRMLLVWFVPFYGIYWLYARAESSLLKLNFTLVLLLYIPYLMTMFRLGYFTP